ncbi:hypothetical protein Tco_0994340, partial [Tanacetum coccineum]
MRYNSHVDTLKGKQQYFSCNANKQEAGTVTPENLSHRGCSGSESVASVLVRQGVAAVYEETRQEDHNNSLTQGASEPEASKLNKAFDEEKTHIPKEELLNPEESEPSSTTEKGAHSKVENEELDELVKTSRQTTREELIRTMRKHVNALAWTTVDMTGTPHFIVEHQLKAYQHIEPRVQKKRILATDRRNVVKEEMEEWLKAEIVKRVQYPSW